MTDLRLRIESMLASALALRAAYPGNPQCRHVVSALRRALRLRTEAGALRQVEHAAAAVRHARQLAVRWPEAYGRTA